MKNSFSGFERNLKNQKERPLCRVSRNSLEDVERCSNLYDKTYEVAQSECLGEMTGGR